MSEPSQGLFAAGVGLDREHAAIERLVHALGVALDNDERHVLLAELVRDDAADPAVAAEDEVSVELVNHAVHPPAARNRRARPPSTTSVAISVNA